MAKSVKRMNASNSSRLAIPKPESRARVKGRKDREEQKVAKAVRAACVDRDGYCRAFGWGMHKSAAAMGASEHAHMHVARRSKTRGMAPEIRFSTQTSLMLCTMHHDAYDGRSLHRMTIEALTDRGADGPLKFTYRGKSYSEAA